MNRPFIRRHHYVTAAPRVTEERRVARLVQLANEQGKRPIVRVPVETRRSK